MTFKLYFMNAEDESFINRKYTIVTDSVMTLRTSNQV